MEFTVGIVTFERSAHLKKTLKSLIAQSRAPDEVVIIDDSAGDDSEGVVSELREEFAGAGIKLVYTHRSDPSSETRSMTEARNRVLDAASGSVICYIDDDVICPEGWLNAYEMAHREFSSAAAIGGPALDVDKQGEDIDLIETVENQNRLNRFGECHMGSPNWIPSRPVRTHHFRGANMSFKKNYLERIGGFNPVYQGPAFFEEVDVLARLWKQGESIIYYPDAKVYHLTAGDSADVTRQTQDPEVWYWSARNGLVFRHNVFPETFFIALIRVLVHPNPWPGPLWKTAGAYLLTRDERRLMAIKGYVDGLRQILSESDS